MNGAHLACVESRPRHDGGGSFEA